MGLYQKSTNINRCLTSNILKLRVNDNNSFVKLIVYADDINILIRNNQEFDTMLEIEIQLKKYLEYLESK